MFLQETYMSTLEVSDEYTLDLAKCIYEYLRDFYPSPRRYWLSVLSMPNDFLKVLSNSRQKTYYKKEYVTSNQGDIWTGNYILATSNDSWRDNTYFVKGPECTISDIYTLGMQTGILGDGTIVYNDNFPGIYTYELLGYTKDLPTPKDILTLTNEQKTYTLDKVVPFIKILENPELNKLNQKYQIETALRQSGQKAMTDREYSRLNDSMKFIEESRKCFAPAPSSSITAAADIDLEDTLLLDNVLNFVSDGLSWVNQYNIYSWPINETILQFLNPETVITETSNMDDIAQMQLLAESAGYIIGQNLGLFDEEFKNFCIKTQENLLNTDSRVIVTGYCDIFVERYIRSKNPVRTEVY